MHPVLCNFMRQYFYVVVGAVLPVVATAFLSIPFSLGGHPGELRLVAAVLGQHLT